MTAILRDPHFAEAACFVADLADENDDGYDPTLPVRNLLGDECMLEDFLLTSYDPFVQEEDEGVDLDILARPDRHSRPRRIVRARHVLAPIAPEDIPVVAEATQHYFTALRSMFSDLLIADLLDDEQDDVDPSEKYDEYDRLDTTPGANGRRAQLLAHSARIRCFA